jgi:hypothetical protein
MEMDGARVIKPALDTRRLVADYKFQLACDLGGLPFDLHDPGAQFKESALSHACCVLEKSYVIESSGDLIVRNLIPGRLDVLDIEPKPGACITDIVRREGAEEGHIVKATDEKMVIVLDKRAYRIWYQPRKPVDKLLEVTELNQKRMESRVA